MVDYDVLTKQAILNAAVEAEEFNLVAVLNPKIFIDGDKYCVLFGDDIQSGVAGFGDTPILAVYDFNKAWRSPVNGADSIRQGGVE